MVDLDPYVPIVLMFMAPTIPYGVLGRGRCLGSLCLPYVLDFHAFGFGPVGHGEEHLYRVVIVVF